MNTAFKIGYRNLADTAILAASAQVGTKPVTLLVDPHPARRWSAGLTTVAWVNLTWAAPVTIDCVALMRSSHGGTGRCRVTASHSNGGTDLYDSGDVPALVDPRFGYLIHVLPAPVTTSTLRLYLSDPSVPELRGGRLFVGPLWTPQHAPALGKDFGRAPLATQTVGRGGQTFIGRRANPRATSFTLAALTPAEERTHLRELQRLCSIEDDILVMFDAADPNPGDVSLWGIAKDLQRPRQDNHQQFSATFTITERL
ncbi:hypothetical protein GBZ48_31540 [Azospirillum melinis]|uniref:Uncharacterized protein n=1 Tax=Azospirillum melinis TaxID=328839 RepID=A0ABX2KMZ1_9PROT|nr:hypothetical protein [Azospirillum melinis]MBP2310489.1 hypothetical protein [Azospirillum melinis]NUB03751.1 hypothetical protein [Azospirillum melinis]